jgi:signal transduction histidine kinase/CheY-like chemotaxis protein
MASHDPGQSGDRIQTAFSLAKEREFYRYLPRDKVAYPFAPFGEASQRTSVAIPSRDNVLNSLAQLGAVKLRAERTIISLFGPTHQYILAEATSNGSPGPDQDDDLRLGCCMVLRENGICMDIENLPLANPAENDDSVIVADGCALVMSEMKEREEEEAHRKKYSVVNRILAAKFCAGVPIVEPRGNTIGSYCVFDTQPRQSGVDEASIIFMKQMAATIMEYLDTLHLRYQNTQAKKMIFGLRSFVEGGTTLRDSWLESHDQDVVTEELGSTAEGQLNKKQQDLPKTQSQLPLRPGPHKDSSFLCETEKLPAESDLDVKPPDSAHTPVDGRRLDTERNEQKSTKQSSCGFLSHDQMLQDGPLAALERIFARAANLIRESVEVEGVVFIDARIESFGGLVGYEFREETASSEDSTDSGSVGGSVSSIAPAPYANHPDGDTFCRTLGYSTSEFSTINDDAESDARPVYENTIRESVLKAILNRYPHGKIFSYNQDGSLSDDSSSSSSSGTVSSSSAKELGSTNITRRKQSCRQVANELKGVLGGARSVVFLPLWDSHKARWLAGLLVQTNKPERIFTAENELSYLHAFGNSIMAEVHRLDVELAEKAKNNLATSISHELRSPLHGLLGTADILSDTVMNALQQGMVHTIESCGRTLLDTINHLLDFTYINKILKDHKPKYGHGRPANYPTRPGHEQTNSYRYLLGSSGSLYEVVQLDAVLEEVVECVFAGHSFYNQHQAPERPSSSRGHSRTAVLPSKQTTIIFDVQRAAEWNLFTQAGCWRRILMNIFSNALKYTPEGYIYIGLKLAETPAQGRDASSGSADQKSQYNVILTIKDTGQGIGTEYLHTGLFTPFSQENNLVPGDGLGLSIVRKVLAFLNGSIEVSSEKDKGTEVTIQVPVAPPSIAHGSEGSSPAVAYGLRGNQAQGKTLGLIGFDSIPALERDARLCESLKRLCEQWLHLTVVMATAQNETTPCDFYLMVHTDLDGLDAEGNPLLLNLDQLNKASPLIVVCQSPQAAHNMFARTRSMSRSGDPIVEFISQPCGPRKLAQTLELCIQRQEGHGSDKPEETRWVEMPVSSHISIDIGPRDAPVDRMKISKRPTVETVGNQDNQTSGSSPPVSPAWQDTSSSLAVASSPEVVPEEDLGGSPYRPSILIIEDNPVNLQILVAYVTKQGWSSETATNGLEAVQKFQAHPGKFIMVLIDITMPVMNGFEASRRIRQFEREYYDAQPSSKPSWHPTTIAALTGLDSPDAEQEAFASGIDIFLTKPISRERVLSLLERCNFP